MADGRAHLGELLDRVADLLVQITQSGWYTFKHEFKNDGGVAVELEDLAGLIPADDPDRQLERVGDSPLAPDQTTTSESERSEELAVAPTRLATAGPGITCCCRS